MTEALAELQRKMEAAAAAMDFEEAGRLRDRITLIRGGAVPEEAASSDTSGLVRQQPGSMGLGTSRQRVTPPEGWSPPPKPDLMAGKTKRRTRKSR